MKFKKIKSITINENEKGLLFKNGKFLKLLGAGKYKLYGGRSIETVDIKSDLSSNYIELDELLSKEDVKACYTPVEVKEDELLIMYLDGKVKDAYTTGKYAFYNGLKNVKFETVDLKESMIEGLSPKTIEMLPIRFYKKYVVSPYEKGLLFFNNSFVRILDGGVYYFWKNSIDVKLVVMDSRLINMNVSGQELLTQDKVNLRVNLSLSYKVKDFYNSYVMVDDYEEQLRLSAQLALRDYIGKYKLDELLDNKDAISEYVYNRLKEKESELFVEISEAGVKDIILPGEIRNIMNTILLAEKKAQANVIARREEVASTRSLLNTAKLMEENQTLYKLKELEYLEKICENVGTITLNGSGDVLGQLSALVKRD